MSTAPGRTDQRVPLIHWRTKANFLMAAFIVWLLGCWHLTLVLLGAAGLGKPSATVKAAIKGHPLDPAGSGHGASPVGALVLFGVLTLVSLALTLLVVFRVADRRARLHPVTRPGLADDHDVQAAMGEKRARDLAKRTRPSLGDKHADAPLREVGFVLGHTATGATVVASPEDHVVVKAPTGGGKSTEVMIPAALDAPGPLIVTSTKPDVLDVVYETRARMGRVWVFDPLDIAGWPDRMVWDCVAGCTRSRLATSRGLAFAAGLSTGSAARETARNQGFFENIAADTLTYMLHAAALDGGTVREVIRWVQELSDDAAHEPCQIISTSTNPQAQTMWSGMLRGNATGAEETVSSTRMSLQRLIRLLVDDEVLRWVTPQPGVAAFNAEAFVRSRDTLVLLSDSNASTNVAPLTTMLANETLEVASRLASRSASGRLDPFLRFVGDEITNVAPLPNLPSLVSVWRGLGIHAVIGVQDDSQIEERWGRFRAAEFNSNMVAELALPGIKSNDTLERLSRLVGAVDLRELSEHYDRDSQRILSENSQIRERRALRPEEIRKLDAGTALLLFRNADPAIIRTTPWFRGPDAVTLEASRERTATAREAHAHTLEV